jgi:hypothetical protein
MSAESLLICCWSVPLVLLALIAGVGRWAFFTFDEFFWISCLPALALGFVVCLTTFDCLIGWHWWWATSAAVPGMLVIGPAIQFLMALLGEPEDEADLDEESEAEAEETPLRAGVRLDDRTKKLIRQFDDPMEGQRNAALEKLRAHLAKNNRTFRDLLHEFEGRSNG